MQKIKLIELGIGLLFLTVLYFVFLMPMTTSFMKNPSYELKYKEQVEVTSHTGICAFFAGLSIALIISGLIAKENK
ncbi:MAG: hypothetical protein A2X48_15110 [Lentisphaerae bacterium GWF2_49_21]|nr:MAG: hypothetical protein A2X48_15110 [Lentisphaerae bacterium GWF2_49_21]